MDTYTKSQKNTCLEPDDRKKMMRLFEETTARIQEMSTILSRTQNNSARWQKATIFLGTSTPTGAGSVVFDGIEIVQNCSGADDQCCVIYDHDEGTSTPCA